ncbi:MAG: hypothetical protein GMKNLPBB_02111 [Myxococcota bacterium]|nr:hypothetical protein [Myxococcota bacterium]
MRRKTRMEWFKRIQTVLALCLALIAAPVAAAGIPWEDLDRDGLPDALELTSIEDREAFRGWMISIAISQARRMSDHWNENQRDCAGLVRFAYKEALAAHDLEWRRKLGSPLVDPPPHDVARYRFPDLPLVGDRPFRVRGEDHPRAFSAFADAETLIARNTFRVSRSVRDALPGDLLFFRNPAGSGSRAHVMIHTGAHGRRRPEEQGVVYHTGPDGSGPGLVKWIPVEDLMRHPRREWRPRGSNPYFLGVYRFHILEYRVR